MDMKKLYVLDGAGYLYSSYFAIKNMTNSKGESTNALYGFVRSVLKILKDFEPKHLVVVFDGPNNIKKRKELYPDYKAHRAEMPKDLRYQMEWAKVFCELTGTPHLEIAEVEGDDTMGSIAKWAYERNVDTILCTSDKDMCQLVNDKVTILNTRKDNLIIDVAGVQATYGVLPEQIIDLLAITGDASDNVPGISGFGLKTAAALLQQFGNLNTILDNPNAISGKKKQEVIVAERDKALISRQLVTIDTHVPIPKDDNFYALKPSPQEPLRAFYNDMNFNSLLRESASMKVEASVAYHLVNSETDLDALIEKLQQEKSICFDTETTDLHPVRAELVGIGFGMKPHEAWYVPVNGAISKEAVIEKLKPIFEDDQKGFYGHNVKYDYQILKGEGITIANICFDTLLASYLLNAHERTHSLDALALRYFDKVKIATEELIGKGKTAITMREVPIESVATYCCEDVDYTVRLKEILETQLEERKLSPLLHEIEIPLLRVLAQMERHGIWLDATQLSAFHKELQSMLNDVMQEIYTIAGSSDLNINSRNQLLEVFERLGIKLKKKTKTGYSLDADVLEELKSEYPIAQKILAYREMEKLRSTYVEALPNEINLHTQRIHCSFSQTIAATGRLACSNPNLQNIPVRTTLGKRIREAFQPQKKGWSFLSADYSQIELRMLAHLSEDPILIEAFLAGEDIHTHTASQIFDTPIESVTKEMRESAKAVNFGVIYGQQDFGLAQTLGIKRDAAKSFIDAYFQRYKRVKEFLEECKEQARMTGKSLTFCRRERLIPEINSKNPSIRQAAERLATNTPIQGSAADLMKLAMLEADKQINENFLQAFMVLQIHDELIFEVPDEEINSLTRVVLTAMQDVITLKVPLVVNIAIGKNWKEC